MGSNAKYWTSAYEVRATELEMPVRQVYVWMVTKDRHVIIVSKDGVTWQLPGGKPELNESHRQTAIREVFEETGIDIMHWQDDLQFFGYNTVEEARGSDGAYIQIRYVLHLPVNANLLKISANHEDQHQNLVDVIQAVRAVSLDEILELIPWLESSDEFRSVKPLLS